MLTRLRTHFMGRRVAAALLAATLALVAAPAMAAAQEPAGQDHAAPAHAGGHAPGGEINIQLPDLNQGDFLGMTGHDILLSGLLVSVPVFLGLAAYLALTLAYSFGLKRVPETGDHVEVDGWRLEVVDMDGRRIDKILAQRIPLHRRGTG